MIGLLQSGTGSGIDSSRPSEESGSADSRCAAVTPVTLPDPFGPPPAAAAAAAPPGAPPGPAPFEPSAPGRPPFAAEAPLEAFLPRAGALPPACARPAPAPALLASAPDCPGEPLPHHPPEDTPTGRIGTPPVGSGIFSAGGRGGTEGTVGVGGTSAFGSGGGAGVVTLRPFSPTPTSASGAPPEGDGTVTLTGGSRTGEEPSPSGIGTLTPAAPT